MGAEQVQKAGHNMQDAAASMKQAVDNMEGVLFRHERFLDDWLQGYQAIVESQAKSEASHVE
ncbi:MAG TPA: hypothetical protein VGK96_28325 [Candidatus Sulfotelmatobacter sp.]